MTDDDIAISIRVAALKTRLMELYTPKAAHYWIYTPQRVLDGRCPISMLADVMGYLEVDNIVDQMLDCVHL